MFQSDILSFGRNYLRRNRNLGSELQLSDKESKTSCMLSITPKDILTFAWQIAKGMAYLTDVKVTTPRNSYKKPKGEIALSNLYAFSIPARSQRLGGSERFGGRRFDLQDFGFRTHAGHLRGRHVFEEKQRER